MNYTGVRKLQVGAWEVIDHMVDYKALKLNSARRSLSAWRGRRMLRSNFWLPPRRCISRVTHFVVALLAGERRLWSTKYFDARRGNRVLCAGHDGY